jgi:hypothetical protein
VKLSLLQLQ